MGMSDSAIKSCRDLRVWQDSMALAETSYRLTKEFPKDEIFGPTAQIRRAAASVPANIAEGHGRENTRTLVQFLRVAQGSLKELETHLLLAQRVKYRRTRCNRAAARSVQLVGQDDTCAYSFAAAKKRCRLKDWARESPNP
jgi:four helix bundle protein